MPIAVILGLFLASLAMRPQILAIGPLLPLIRDDLGLPASVAGLLTTIPVLCMGLFAPIGPRVAARLGPTTAFAACLALVVGFGLLRALVPATPLLLLATFGVGVGIGMAGAIPSMVVAQRMPTRPALGTGAYAAGIVAGSTFGAGVAVPLAVEGAWRQSLAVLSIVAIGSLVAWLLLVRGDGSAGVDARRLAARAPRLPWRSTTGWLLVVVFGLQSLLYYGCISWLPNAFVERGWTVADAGALIAAFNGIGLATTIGVPLVADRLGARRSQLVGASVVTTLGLLGVILVPDLAWGWVAILGLALGMIFPLVLTLPIDVADDPSTVGAVAALMLLGGYVLSSIGPVVMGAARDASGSFDSSLWLLVAIGAVLTLSCLTLSPTRLRRGVGRPATPGTSHA